MVTNRQEWFDSVCNSEYVLVKTNLAVFGGSRDSDGMTALMRAAILGDVEMCQILAISESCMVTRNGMTALMYACQSDHASCSKVLAPLEHPVILADCRTALMLAAEAGSYQCCKELLKFLGPERDSNGLGALEYAIIGNNLEVVKLLVEHRNLGRCDLVECARLAAREGYLDIAAWLDHWLLVNKHIKNASSLALNSPNQPGFSPKNIFVRTVGPERTLAVSTSPDLEQPVYPNHDGDITVDMRQQQVQEQACAQDQDQEWDRGHRQSVEMHEQIDNMATTAEGHPSLTNNEQRAAMTNNFPPSISAEEDLQPSPYDDVLINLTKTSEESHEGSEEHLSSEDLVTVQQISKTVKGTEKILESWKKLKNTLAANEHEGNYKHLPEAEEIQLEPTMTPLMQAALTDNLYQAQMNMKYARSVTSNNQTSLMLAIQSGAIRVAKELAIIESGFQDLSGQSALMYAVMLGSLDLVEMLAPMESGLVDCHGCTALMYAAKDDKEDLASVLVRTEACIRNNYGDTALHVAIASGSSNCIQFLAPVEARIRDSRNRVALMNACAKNMLSACRVLVNYEAGQVDEHGHTCLHNAVLAGNIPLVSILAPKEAHIRNNTNKTALMLAIENNNREMIDVLSQFEASVMDHNSVTPLMLISERGMIESLTVVAEKTGNVNCCNLDGQSALMLALQSQQYEVAMQLSQSDGKTIAVKAQHNPKDPFKQIRLLQIAIQDDDIVAVWEIIKRLDPEETKLRYELLEYALKLNRLKIATLISDSIWQPELLKKYTSELVTGIIDQNDLKRGAALIVQRNFQILIRNAEAWKKLSKIPVEQRSIKREQDGYTPLHLAVIENDLIAVWQAHVACSKLTDSNGNTALMLAAIYGHKECVHILLPYEAGMKRNNDGATAMHLALLHHNTEIADILLEKEGPDISSCKRVNGKQSNLMQAADTNDLAMCYCLRTLQQGLVDIEKNTALIYAAKRGNDAAVFLLVKLEHGRQNVKSWSALMYAAFEGHTRCVKILLNYEIKLTDVSGVTALMLAAFQGHTEIVELLIPGEAGIQTRTGHTALLSAAKNGHVHAAELLVEYEAGMTTSQGVTALMEAALLGHVEVVRLLAPLESGFSTLENYSNGSGFTALMAAAQGDNPECYDILWECEKDLVQPNGMKAEMYALGPRMQKYLSG